VYFLIKEFAKKFQTTATHPHSTAILRFMFAAFVINLKLSLTSRRYQDMHKQWKKASLNPESGKTRKRGKANY